MGSAFAGPLGWGARAAWVLRAGGFALGAATTASEFPQLQLMDLAAKSGTAGGEKLTNQTPEEAKMNLAMGYANLALVGMDGLGLAPSAVKGLMKVPGAVRSAAALSREQLTNVITWARQGPAGVAKARALLGSVKGFGQRCNE